MLLTRRKHQVPPQPLSWFRNLIECLGNKLTIHVAFKDGQPASGILTLFSKDCCVYKYSCSDPKFSSSAATVYLLWHVIKDAKVKGATEIDMGRCDIANEGLATFKEHWNATRSSLVYYRSPVVSRDHANGGRRAKLAQHLFAKAPDWMLITLGNLLYKHVG